MAKHRRRLGGRVSTKGIAITAAFNWNYKSSIIIQRKGFTKELNKASAEIFSRHMYKYIPYDTGLMSNSVRVSATGDKGIITYTTKYAKEQYWGPDDNWNRNRTVHPLATSLWDKQCWAVEKREIINEINAYRRSHSR